MNLELMNKDLYSLINQTNDKNEKINFCLDENTKKINKLYKHFFYLKTDFYLENNNININITLYSPFTISKENYKENLFENNEINLNEKIKHWNNLPLLDRIKLIFSEKNKNLLEKKGLNKLDIKYLKDLENLENTNIGILTDSFFEDKISGKNKYLGGINNLFNTFDFKNGYGKTMFKKPDKINTGIKDYYKYFILKYLIDFNEKKFKEEITKDHIIYIRSLKTNPIKEYNKFFEEFFKDKNFNFNEINFNFKIQEDFLYLLNEELVELDILTNVFYNVELNNKLLFNKIIDEKDNEEYKDKIIKFFLFNETMNDINNNPILDFSDDIYNYKNKLHNIFVSVMKKNESSGRERKTFRFFDNNNKCNSIYIDENHNKDLLKNSLNLINDDFINYTNFYYLKIIKNNNIEEKLFYSFENKSKKFIEIIINLISYGYKIIDLSINKKRISNNFPYLELNKNETNKIKQNINQIQNKNKIIEKVQYNKEVVETFKNYSYYIIEINEKSISKENKLKINKIIQNCENLLKNKEELNNNFDNILEKLEINYQMIEGIFNNDLEKRINNKIKENIINPHKEYYKYLMQYNIINNKFFIINKLIELVYNTSKNNNNNKLAFQNNTKIIFQNYLKNDKNYLIEKEKKLFYYLTVKNENNRLNVLKKLKKLIYFNENIVLTILKKGNEELTTINSIFKDIIKYNYSIEKDKIILIKKLLLLKNEDIIKLFNNKILNLKNNNKINDYNFKKTFSFINSNDFQEILNNKFLLFVYNLFYYELNDNTYKLKNFDLTKFNLNRKIEKDNELEVSLAKTFYLIKNSYYNRLNLNNNVQPQEIKIDFNDINLLKIDQKYLYNKIKEYYKKYGEYFEKNYFINDEIFNKCLESIEKLKNKENFNNFNKILFIKTLYNIK